MVKIILGDTFTRSQGSDHKLPKLQEVDFLNPWVAGGSGRLTEFDKLRCFSLIRRSGDAGSLGIFKVTSF